MKILAFAGSNSSKSINHQLVSFAASLTENTEVIRLTDYEIPMYGFDIEESDGIPDGIKKLASKIEEADALLVSVCEHNGNVSAFFKNITDWLSRNDRGFVTDKKVVILSTSPGARGAISAQGIAKNTFTRFNAEVVSTWSLGSFYNNMKDGVLEDKELLGSLKLALAKFK